jgi:hypothetical protein
MDTWNDKSLYLNWWELWMTFESLYQRNLEAGHQKSFIALTLLPIPPWLWDAVGERGIELENIWKVALQEKEELFSAF